MMNQPMIEQRKETGRRIGDMHAVDEFRMKFLEEENAALKYQIAFLMVEIKELRNPCKDI
jgi:hypothetical protein